MKTVVGLFDYIEDAESAVGRLEAAGIDRHDISVMADDTRRHATQFSEDAASAAEDKSQVIAVDAAAGAALGGATGLLMALTGLVIPGFGPIVAAGWLVSTLAGAAVGAGVGGLAGALTGAGIPLEDAVYYKEGIKAGATLIAVRVAPGQAQRVADLMEQQGAVDTHEQGAQDGQLSPTDNSLLQRPIVTPPAAVSPAAAVPASPAATDTAAASVAVGSASLPFASPAAGALSVDGTVMMPAPSAPVLPTQAAGTLRPKNAARIYPHVSPDTAS